MLLRILLALRVITGCAADRTGDTDYGSMDLTLRSENLLVCVSIDTSEWEDIDMMFDTANFPLVCFRAGWSVAGYVDVGSECVLDDYGVGEFHVVGDVLSAGDSVCTDFS